MQLLSQESRASLQFFLQPPLLPHPLMHVLRV
jgi:hypothetical protein